MAVRTSAALLAYRHDAAGRIEVFLTHMGGPFWAHRDLAAWSIPKGEYDAGTEDPLAVARREFREEIGVAAPVGGVIDLGECRQPSGKRIRTFAVPTAEPLAFVSSNTFTLEWPRGSGHLREFPETDDAQWFDLPTAAAKLVPGQVPILDALVRAVDRP